MPVLCTSKAVYVCRYSLLHRPSKRKVKSCRPSVILETTRPGDKATYGLVSREATTIRDLFNNKKLWYIIALS